MLSSYKFYMYTFYKLCNDVISQGHESWFHQNPGFDPPPGGGGCPSNQRLINSITSKGLSTVYGGSSSETCHLCNGVLGPPQPPPPKGRFGVFGKKNPKKQFL
jgi:hypothetical protein